MRGASVNFTLEISCTKFTWLIHQQKKCKQHDLRLEHFRTKQLIMDLLVEKAHGVELVQVIIGTYEEYLIGFTLNYDPKTVSSIEFAFF